jgi:hypothetical protein
MLSDSEDDLQAVSVTRDPGLRIRDHSSGDLPRVWASIRFGENILFNVKLCRIPTVRGRGASAPDCRFPDQPAPCYHGSNSPVTAQSQSRTIGRGSPGNAGRQRKWTNSSSPVGRSSRGF